MKALLPSFLSPYPAFLSPPLRSVWFARSPLHTLCPCGKEEVDPSHVPEWGQGHVLLMVAFRVLLQGALILREFFTFLPATLSHRGDGVLLPLDPSPWHMLFYPDVLVV